MKTTFLLGGLAVASLFATVNAPAQLLSYDPFSYPAGSLVGQDGGTGFGGAYTASGSGTTVDPVGLTYTDSTGATLPTAGNAADLPGGNNGAFRALSGTFGGGDATVFVSFIELVNSSANYAGLSLFTGAGGSEHLFIGSGGGGNSSPALNLEATGPGIGAGETPLTTSSFLVVELQFGASSPNGTGVTVSLFQNPTLGAPSAPPNLVDNNTGSFTFDTIRIQSGSDTGEVDEVRIGDTYADVAPIAPVPEPTTMAMTLLGGAGVLLLLRRRLA